MSLSCWRLARSSLQARVLNNLMELAFRRSKQALWRRPKLANRRLMRRKQNVLRRYWRRFLRAPRTKNLLVQSLEEATKNRRSVEAWTIRKGLIIKLANQNFSLLWSPCSQWLYLISASVAAQSAWSSTASASQRGNSVTLNAAAPIVTTMLVKRLLSHKPRPIFVSEIQMHLSRNLRRYRTNSNTGRAARASDQAAAKATVSASSWVWGVQTSASASDATTWYQKRQHQVEEEQLEALSLTIVRNA